MNLQQQISFMQQEMIKEIPDEVLNTLMDANAQMLSEMPGKIALKEGDVIPDFTLYRHNGEPLAIKDILQKKNLLISFYRGTWCPYCSVELRALVKYYDAIKDAGAELVAISPELPDHSMSQIEKEQIQFPVLSDPGNRIAGLFGIVVHLSEVLQKVYQGFDFDLVKKNGDLNWNLPIPATYLVRQDGTIHYAYINPDYTQRMEPDEIIQELHLL
ncbi:MAG: peroxiredoxin-like family protein [Gammaproteobacteria bacterium]|nr:peroxiredoxin-like family protein [Gammaproteobacteria bacterium]